MSTACEFLNCSNTSEDTKINRLRIHENLATKWDQVFNENISDRIGEYLYICCAHFDSNTKKLILPKPIRAQEIEEVTRTIKQEAITSHVPSITSQRKTVVEGMKFFFSDVDQVMILFFFCSSSRIKFMV